MDGELKFTKSESLDGGQRTFNLQVSYGARVEIEVELGEVSQRQTVKTDKAKTVRMNLTTRRTPQYRRDGLIWQLQAEFTKGSAFYYVETADGLYECKARGAFRKQRITPLVGDRVEITVNAQGRIPLTLFCPAK